MTGQPEDMQAPGQGIVSPFGDVFQYLEAVACSGGWGCCGAVVVVVVTIIIIIIMVVASL